nr:tetratricopeptide repeat protein [Neptunicella marina]
MRFFSELRRRNVVKTLVAYLGLVWLILQVIATTSPYLNLSPRIGTFFTVVFLAGIPVVFYIAWYFDITLHGLKRIPNLTDEPLKPLGPVRWTGLAIIFVGCTFLGINLFEQIQSERGRVQDGTQLVKKAQAMAVMPFRDLSPEQDQSYLAEGIAEELSSLLGEKTGLQVSAFTSVLMLSRQQLSPMDIGRRLDVDAVLSGSVRAIGDRLKIRLELIDSQNGQTLWSDTLQRKLADVFSMESEIGRSVTNLLQDNYFSAEHFNRGVSAASTDAYVMYLKGREQYRMQTTESMKQARKLFEQAVVLDPEYTQAYVGLADTLVMLSKSQHRFGVLEPHIAAQLAEQNLTKVFVRDDSIARAYAIQGKVFELQQQPDQALSSYNKAISLNPNLAIAYMWRFSELQRQNRYEDALESLKKATQLDPLSIANQFNLGFEYTRKGQYQHAQAQFEQLIKDFPESPMGYKGLASVAYCQGHLAESLMQWQKAQSVSPDDSNLKYQFLDVLVQLKLGDELKKRTDDEAYTPSLLLINGQYEQLFKLMDFQVAANPDDPWILFEAAWYQMLVGDEQVAGQLLIRAYPLMNSADIYGMPYCSPAIEFAWAFKGSGQMEQADQLIQRCESGLASARKIGINNIYDYLGARIAALKNQPDEAVKSLAEAVNKGWMEWWTPHDPLLASIQSQAQVMALNQQITENLEQQSQKAQQLLSKTN